VDDACGLVDLNEDGLPDLVVAYGRAAGADCDQMPRACAYCGTYAHCATSPDAICSNIPVDCTSSLFTACGSTFSHCEAATTQGAGARRLSQGQARPE